MKKSVALLAVVFCTFVGTVSLPGAASRPVTLPLWPDLTKPGSDSTEKDMSKPNDRAVADRPVLRLGNISSPTLTVYPAPASATNGAAVMICPGGGYRILAMDLEGTEIAEWLNSIGVTAAVLKYRVPVQEGRPRHELPLQDAQRAMGILRSRAAEWKLDPKRLGVMGFSAGAHLSAVLSCQYSNRTYKAVDAADQTSCRPDFVMLVYPAYLTVDKENHAIATELPISGNNPPCFIVQTEDDPVRPEGGLFYYAALKKANVPAELHLYATGGHGYGLRRTRDAVTAWPELAQEWLKGLGMLAAPRP